MCFFVVDLTKNDPTDKISREDWMNNWGLTKAYKILKYAARNLLLIHEISVWSGAQMTYNRLKISANCTLLCFFKYWYQHSVKLTFDNQSKFKA